MIHELAHAKRVHSIVLDAAGPGLPPKITQLVKGVSFLPTVVPQLHALLDDLGIVAALNEEFVLLLCPIHHCVGSGLLLSFVELL